MASAPGGGTEAEESVAGSVFAVKAPDRPKGLAESPAEVAGAPLVSDPPGEGFWNVNFGMLDAGFSSPAGGFAGAEGSPVPAASAGAAIGENWNPVLGFGSAAAAVAAGTEGAGCVGIVKENEENEEATLSAAFAVFAVAAATAGCETCETFLALAAESEPGAASAPAAGEAFAPKEKEKAGCSVLLPADAAGATEGAPSDPGGFCPLLSVPPSPGNANDAPTFTESTGFAAAVVSSAALAPAEAGASTSGAFTRLVTAGGRGLLGGSRSSPLLRFLPSSGPERRFRGAGRRPADVSASPCSSLSEELAAASAAPDPDPRASRPSRPPRRSRPTRFSRFSRFSPSWLSPLSPLSSLPLPSPRASPSSSPRCHSLTRSGFRRAFWSGVRLNP